MSNSEMSSFDELKSELADYDRDALIRIILQRDWRIAEMENVIALIPGCSLHGVGCLPNAREWIRSKLVADEVMRFLDNFNTEPTRDSIGLPSSLVVDTRFAQDMD